MIVLSFLLVIVAAVTLIIGLFQDTLAWIWTSIASCVVAMIFLGIGVLQRRGRTTPAAADAGYGGASSSGSGTLVRAAERALPGREGRDEDEVSVVPRTSVRDARPNIDEADTSRVEPTVLPKRTAEPSRAESERDLERAAEEGVAAVDEEDIRPVKKAAASRRTTARKRTAAEPTEERPAKKAAKRTKKAAKGTKKAAKRSAKKAAKKTAAAGTTGAAAKRRLAEVKGVGPAKQQALLDAFGSLEAIRDASVGELTDVKGVGEATAQELKDALS